MITPTKGWKCLRLIIVDSVYSPITPLIKLMEQQEAIPEHQVLQLTCATKYRRLTFFGSYIIASMCTPIIDLDIELQVAISKSTAVLHQCCL